MPTELIKTLNEEEDTKNLTNTNNKRIKPLLNSKFATDKFNHSLRRDLLVSNFDKTMTVEKARFEPLEDPIVATTQSAPISTQQANTTKTETSLLSDDIGTHRGDPNNKSELAHSPPATYALTMSPSAPTLSANTTNNEHTLLNSTPLTTTLSHNDKRRLTQVRSEGNQNINSSTSRKKQNNKKQTKPMVHGTASPAEVFHRNLVDAVSNVEDSDENEHYVYPYSGNESSGHHDMTGIHRPLSVRSTPVTLLNDLKKKNSHQGIGDWLRYALSRNNVNNASNTATFQSVDEEDEEEGWSGYEYNRRPKLRSQIKDHRTHENSSTSSLLSRWHDSFRSASSDKNANTRKSRRTYPPMQKIGSQQPTHYYTNGGIGNHHNHLGSGGGGGLGGYTSDEEDAPLLSRRQQQKRMPRSSKKQTCKNIFRNSILFIIFVISVLCIIIVYKAQPLVELTVDMGRVLATDKELIFDLKVQAENWNWWTIHVADADISVFAFSQIVPSYMIANDLNTTIISSAHTRGVDPAEYLGNLLHFDEPLSIPSSLFNKGPIEAISQIRIKSPGADASGNERWSRMIRYPYGLVVRGVLKYKPLPFIMGMYPQSAAVCNVNRVDPTTGAVSTDPDKTICAGQQDDNVNIFSR